MNPTNRYFKGKGKQVLIQVKKGNKSAGPISRYNSKKSVKSLRTDVVGPVTID